LLNSLNVSEQIFEGSNNDIPVRGMVEVFTGEGKGKTSAALGIVLRAAGHGLRIHIIFFMKGEFPYGEQKTLGNLPNVTFDRFGFKTFVNPDNIKPAEKQQAQKALETARSAMLSKNYDVVVLDEVNVAVSWKLIDVEDVVQLIKEKPENVELILTGRYANPKIVELADLVTEMVKIKHPYDSGQLAHKGIDY